MSFLLAWHSISRITWCWINFLALPSTNQPSLWNLKVNMSEMFVPLHTLVFLLFFSYIYVLIGWYISWYFCLPFPTFHLLVILFIPQMSPLPRCLPWFSLLALTSHSWAPWLCLWKWLLLAQVLCVCSSVLPGSGGLTLSTTSAFLYILRVNQTLRLLLLREPAQIICQWQQP